MSKATRVLIAPSDISGFYEKLVKGLQEIGLDAHFANFNALVTNYTVGGSRWFFVRRGQNLLLRASLHRNPRTIRFRFFTLRTQIYMFLTLLSSLFRVDTYIFVYGRSFLPRNLDLLLLKLLKKQVISVIGHGNEARPTYLSFNGISNVEDVIAPEVIRSMYRRNLQMKKNLRRIEKYSTYSIASTCTSQLLTTEFIEMLALRQPIIPILTNNPVSKESHIVRVLHCPSDPAVKGSYEFRKIMSDIQELVPQVEYVELTGVSNEEVLRVISEVDLVIDALWSDSPMAMIGYESASIGTPCITFGAALETLQKLNEQIPLPLFGYFDCSDAQKTILHFVTDPQARKDLAHLQGQYVNQFASLNHVAKNFSLVISGKAPKAWYVNPKDYCYVGGSGLPPEISIMQMTALKESYGIASL
jgi:hypothetical protein